MARPARSVWMWAGLCWAALAIGQSGPALAVDGTWTGATDGEWTDPTNWSSNPSVPDGTATFTNTASTTSVANNGGLVSIGAVSFTSTALSYSFGINNTFVVTAAGVTNASTNTQTFNVSDTLIFQNASSANAGTGAVNYVNAGFIYFQNTSNAGTAATSYTNNSILQFFDSSSAGSASFTDNAVMDFFDSSKAGTATITNAATGTLTFNNISSADHASIANSGTLNFTNSSTAGKSAITGAGNVGFYNSSTAASSTIDLSGGILSFHDTSTAGSATIGSSSPAAPMSIEFHDNSTAGSANITVIGNAGSGTLDFYDSATGGTAHITNDQGVPGSGGLTRFHNTSSALNAIILNQNLGATQFTDTSTAGSASITNGTNGSTAFLGNSTAGAANIINNSGGSTSFQGNSLGGTAQITNNSGGFLFFEDASDASTARVINNSGGTVDISLATTGTSVGSIEGSGDIFLGAKTLTLGNTNLSVTIGGVIADGGTGGGIGGSLTKVGTGTLTLTGASTYTGDTNVNGGTLVVNGSLLSTVLVNSGGTLQGTGTIGGLTANSGGIVAPGNSIGTLNVTGNVAFGPGSFYQVEANAAGQADKIQATGTASITGGTVQVLAATGTYAPSTTYTILSAPGGRTGQFSSVTSSLAFLTPTLSYTATDVLLTLSLASFSNVGQTPNQRAVGAALNASPTSSALVQAVLPLTTPQALVALDALSGEVYGSTQTVLAMDAGYLRQAILERLRTAGYGGPGAVASLGIGGPATAYAAEPKTAFAAAPAERRFTFWAQGVGGWGRVDGDGNAASLTRDIGGVFSGVDADVGATGRLGLAAGYSQSRVNVSDRASAATIDSAHIAGYGGVGFGNFRLRGGAGYSWSEIDASRTIAFTGFFNQTTAGYRAGTAQVFGEIGYGVDLGRIGLEPFAGAAWESVDTGSFSENGGSFAALNGASNRFNVAFSSLGLRAFSAMPLSNGMMLIPRASATWQHAFDDVTPEATLSFANTGAGFTVAGVPLARDSALLEASLDLQVTPQARLGVAFTGQFANRTSDPGVKGKFSVQF